MISLLIFVVMFSLMPTLAVYYFWFLGINLIIQTVRLLLSFLLSLFNTTPVFPLLFYCANYIPVAVQFKVKKDKHLYL